MRSLLRPPVGQTRSSVPVVAGSELGYLRRREGHRVVRCLLLHGVMEHRLQPGLALLPVAPSHPAFGRIRQNRGKDGTKDSLSAQLVFNRSEMATLRGFRIH